MRSTAPLKKPFSSSTEEQMLVEIFREHLSEGTARLLNLDNAQEWENTFSDFRALFIIKDTKSPYPSWSLNPEPSIEKKLEKMKNFLKILVEMQTKLKGQTEGNLSTDSHKIYLNVAIGKAKEIIEGYLSNLKAEAFPKYQKAIKEFVTDHPLPPSVFALSGYKLFIKGKPQTVTHMFADIGRAVGLAKEEKKKDDHTEEQKFYALKPDLGRKLDAISKDYPNIKNPETSIDVIPCDTDEHKRCRVAKALWDFICKVETKLKNNEIPPSELDLQQALAVALNPQADLQKAARPERKGLSS